MSTLVPCKYLFVVTESMVSPVNKKKKKEPTDHDIFSYVTPYKQYFFMPYHSMSTGTYTEKLRLTLYATWCI